MIEKIILPPNPERLIEGLRDTGYDFNTALSDIVDNSIDAESTIIDIRIDIDSDGDILISVADNGIGMDSATLLNGMTYGAKGQPDHKRLGKFGLGLKTASTAYCRRLSVVTRDNEKDINKAIWDLDNVARAKAWELLIDEPSDYELEILDEVSSGESGTLVIWDKVDRLLKDYQDPGGAPARKALDKVIKQYIFHASMIYQRFLDENDARARNISMLLNGEKIEAWNPFCESESETEMVAEAEKDVLMEDGTKAWFKIRAFVLPRKEQFSSVEESKNARLVNNMQGFYIYRENRLIHPHDWLNMFSKEPHMTLLRVEFSFSHELDSAFQVDIKKSRIQLKEELYQWIKSKFISAPRNAAASRYRTGQRKKVLAGSKNAHHDSNANIESKEQDLRMAQVKVLDKDNNQVEVTNKKGSVVLRLTIDDSGDKTEVNVDSVDSIDDGLLWEPALLHGHHAVKINAGHPYYTKVYVPNYSSGVTIQGLDSLLWALAEAELGTVNEATKNHFLDLRFEISRLLRKLVDDLPDPELDDEIEVNE